MKPDEIIKIIEYIKEQTDFKGDIFININSNAIPVEWINDWLETCIPHYDYDKLTYIADVYEMLEDWEKENEID